MEQQLLQEQKKPNMLAFQVAIGYTFFYLIFVIVSRATGINLQDTEAPVLQLVITSILTWGIFIFAIVYTQVKHKKELGGFVTFGRAFSAGFKVAAYTGLFVSILMLVYYQLIDTTAVDEILDLSIKKAKNEQEIQAIQMMAKYIGIFTAFGAGILFSFVGLLISLISAAIVQKTRPLDFNAPFETKNPASPDGE